MRVMDGKGSALPCWVRSEQPVSYFFPCLIFQGGHVNGRSASVPIKNETLLHAGHSRNRLHPGAFNGGIVASSQSNHAKNSS